MNLYLVTLDQQGEEPPRLSIAISNSVGEIRVSVSTGEKGDEPAMEFGSRPIGTPSNLQNTSAAVAAAVVINKSSHAVVSIALLNTSQNAGVGRVELAAFSGDKSKELEPVVDEQNLLMPVGVSWTAHVLVRVK